MDAASTALVQLDMIYESCLLLIRQQESSLITTDMDAAAADTPYGHRQTSGHMIDDTLRLQM